MRINKIILTILLSAFLFSGCADTPSEVKQEIENYDNAEAIQDDEIGYMPPSDAIAQAKVFQENNSTNISFENLVLPDSSNMPNYSLKFSNKHSEELFTKLQSESLIANFGDGTAVQTSNDLDVWKSNKNYCFTSFPELDGFNYYRNSSDVKQADWGTYYGQNMRITDSGCITLYADELNTGIGSAVMYPAEKRYIVDFSHDKDEYTLCDGSTMSVEEAVDFAQQFCNDNLSVAENKYFQYQVNYIDARKVEPDQYGYYISLCRKDQYGNFFDATHMYAYAYEEFETRNALIAPYIYLWVTSSNNIAEFEMYYSFEAEETGTYDKIVTLESAVNILSDTLAQGKSYDFEIAELKYVLEVTRSDYIDDAREYVKSGDYDRNMYGNVVYSPDSIYAYGNYEITAVPYWVFTDIMAQNNDTNCGSIFMVNAVDGSVRIENIDEYGNLQLHY